MVFYNVHKSLMSEKLIQATCSNNPSFTYSTSTTRHCMTFVPIATCQHRHFSTRLAENERKKEEDDEQFA